MGRPPAGRIEFLRMDRRSFHFKSLTHILASRRDCQTKCRKTAFRNPRGRNAFSLSETLFVLLLIGLSVSVFSLTPRADSSGLSSRILLEKVNQEQYLAFSLRQPRAVDIQKDRMLSGQESFAFPKGLACTPMKLSWNETGSISKGGTLRCTAGTSSFRIVFQLGSGRARIESGP